MAKRTDLDIIVNWISAGTRVLDVGCADGLLLQRLTHEKQVDGRGIELEQTHVATCLAKGLSVVQGDANSDLPHYPDNSFDYVIMGHTLQRMTNPAETLSQLLRIGKQVIVSVPNFAHIKNRLYLTFKGQMPVTRSLRYAWYETPNIHFCSLTDFLTLCQDLDASIEHKIYIHHNGNASQFMGLDWCANLFAEQGVFLLQK